MYLKTYKYNNIIEIKDKIKILKEGIFVLLVKK